MLRRGGENVRAHDVTQPRHQAFRKSACQAKNAILRVRTGDDNQNPVLDRRAADLKLLAAHYEATEERAIITKPVGRFEVAALRARRPRFRR